MSQTSISFMALTFKIFFVTRHQQVLDGSIRLAMKKRQVKAQARGLTEQDLFFREVSMSKYKLSY